MVCTQPLEMQDLPVLSFRNATCQISEAVISASVLTFLLVSVAGILVYKFYFHLLLFVGCKNMAEVKAPMTHLLSTPARTKTG